MSERRIVIAFDAYGTLLSTESIAKQLAEHFGEEKGSLIAQTWRKYQLEYTWRLNSMSTTYEQERRLLTIADTYVDFEQVTRGSLVNALLEAEEALSDDQIDELMKAYNTLTIFPDVATTLQQLRDKTNIYPVVFSNGTQSMVSTSVKESPDLKEYKDVLKDIVLVEEPRRYKPAPEVYHHLAERTGIKPDEMSQMWLVSGNPFDIVGARSMGMNAAWVDRAGKGWQDRMIGGELGRPTRVLRSLDEIVDVASATL